MPQGKRQLLVLLPPKTKIHGDWCVVEIPMVYETGPRELEPRELEPRELEPPTPLVTRN